MRQGGGPGTGKWQGEATGGVTAPVAVILPAPAARFAATAARLATRAPGHPMADWLTFMAALAAAQAEAATALAVEAVAETAVRQAVAAGLPPLAADGHRRQALWQEALDTILAAMGQQPLPDGARQVVEKLAAMGSAAREELAGQFLSGEVPARDAGSALFVAAALQVYFAALAAKLPVDALRPLAQPGLCPACGSTPVAGVITAGGRTPGVRYLHCSLCSTAWNHVRAICITCGDSRDVTLKGIDGAGGLVMAETCGSCGTYAKMFYQKEDMAVDPFADDLASLALDLMVAEAGWPRHAPIPLLLVG